MFWTFWQQLTEPQAIIVSGLLTLISGILVAFVAPFVIGQRFSSLSDKADKVNDLTKSVGREVDSLSGKISSVSEAVTPLLSLPEIVTRVNNAVVDLAAAEPQSGTDQEVKQREDLKSLWTEIRDRVEAIAASPAIDGRTRARYGRIDRRIFKKVIDALNEDHLLGANEPLLTEALNIWHTYRSNRVPVPEQQLMKMADLRNKLVSNGALHIPTAGTNVGKTLAEPIGA